MSTEPPQTPSTPNGSSSTSAPPSTIPKEIIEVMLDTKPWVTFLAVAGFIICGLLVLSGVGIILGVEGFGEKTPPVGLLYFLITFLCAVPSLALWRVGASLRRLMRGDGMPALREAMSHMRSFFRLVGIMMLMMIALDLVALIYLATIPKVG